MARLPRIDLNIPHTRCPKCRIWARGNPCPQCGVEKPTGSTRQDADSRRVAPRSAVFPPSAYRSTPKTLLRDGKKRSGGAQPISAQRDRAQKGPKTIQTRKRRNA
jgi:hypothetical protein